MLPLDLVKLIKKYLNSDNILLLTSLIKLVNNFYIFDIRFGTFILDIIKTNINKINSISTVQVTIGIIPGFNRHIPVLDITNFDNVDKQYIELFIMTCLDYNNIPFDAFLPHITDINSILLQYNFGNYLVPFSNSNRDEVAKRVKLYWANMLIQYHKQGWQITL